MDIQRTRSVEAVRTAIQAINDSRIMPRRMIVEIFEDVLDELILLRADASEWICLACSLTFYKDSVMPDCCPDCGELLQPASWCFRKIYESKMADRDAKISNLEFIIETLADLELNQLTETSDT